MTSELVILRGLPASGKTTYAREWVAEDPDNRVRVNRDDIRALFYGIPSYEHVQESAVTAAEHSMTEVMLRTKKSVVVDNTNLRARYVLAFMKIAARLPDVTVQVQDFEISVDEAIERDAARGKAGGRLVGREVIEGMASRFLRKGKLPPVPELNELAVAGERYVPNPALPSAVLVDLDGTVALHAHRGPHDYARVLTDEPNLPVIRVALALRSAGYPLVFLSGRPDSCREDTETWLREHFHRGSYSPFMRAAGDNRNDAIVKRELFDKYVRPRYNVLAVLDDRPRVIRMWASLGLPVFDVDPMSGEF